MRREQEAASSGRGLVAPAACPAGAPPPPASKELPACRPATLPSVAVRPTLVRAWGVRQRETPPLEPRRPWMDTWGDHPAEIVGGHHPLMTEGRGCELDLSPARGRRWWPALAAAEDNSSPSTAEPAERGGVCGGMAVRGGCAPPSQEDKGCGTLAVGAGAAFFVPRAAPLLQSAVARAGERAALPVAPARWVAPGAVAARNHAPPHPPSPPALVFPLLSLHTSHRR